MNKVQRQEISMTANECWINKSVIQEYTSKVDLSGITVYCFLASMVDSEQKCFPSQKYIAEKLGCSRATVSRDIKTDGKQRIDQDRRSVIDTIGHTNCQGFVTLMKLRCRT